MAAPPSPRPAQPLVGLTRRAEFLAAAKARRAGVASLGLQARQRSAQDGSDAGTDPEAVRVGFTCSKKVGNAVARNRAKRRLREVARAVLSDQGRPGWDYVLIGRAGTTAERPFPALLDDLRHALDRVHRAAPSQSGGRSAKPSQSARKTTRDTVQ